MGCPVPPGKLYLNEPDEDWTRPHLVLDTAKKSIEAITEELLNRLRKDC